MADDVDSAFRSLFKSGSIVFVGFVLEMAISFFGKIIVARWLTQVDYGAVALGSTLLSTLAMIGALGLHTGIGRNLSRYDDESNRRGVIASAFQIAVPISVVTGSAVFLLANTIATRVFDSPELGPVLRVFAIALPFLTATKLSLGAIQGAQRTLPKVYIQNIGTPALRFVLIIVGILLGGRVLDIAWAYSLARIVPAIAALYFVYKLTPLFTGREYVSMHRELLVFSAPLVISSAMGRVLSDLDTYLLGYYTDLGLVGTYNVIYPIVTTTGFVLSAFSYLTLPVISELHADERHQEMLVLFQGITKWVFLTTLPLLLGIVFFPRLVISVTFGSKYLAGATALQVLVLTYFVSSITGPSIQMLTSVGETRRLMWFNVVAASVNVVLNVMLIPRYELLGAAVATVISLVLLEVLVSVRLYRQMELHPFSRALLFPAVFGIALSTGLYAVLMTAFQPSIVSAIGLFAAFVPLYGIGILRLGGIQHQDIMIIHSIEDRFDVNLDLIRRVARRLM